jgi:uncharacterized protein (TIGR02444 family)
MPHTSCVAVASKYNKYPAQPPAARVNLREFALGLYGVDGVPPACLLLQDRFGLDVNVLLLAAYLGVVHRRTLTADQLADVRELADPWRSEVVEPLRAVRRRLKSGPAPAPSPQTAVLRSEVARLELDAELIELDQLNWWASVAKAQEITGRAAQRALDVMRVVVAGFSQSPLSDEDRAAIATIAAAAAAQDEPDA